MTKGAVQLGYMEKLVKKFIETAVGKGYEGNNPIMNRLSQTLEAIQIKEQTLAKEANAAMMKHEATGQVSTKFQDMVGKKGQGEKHVDRIAAQATTKGSALGK